MTSSGEWFEEYAVAALFRPLAEELIKVADPQPGERVLDVACGTGIAARLAGQRLGAGSTVAGIDMDQDRLETARSRASREGLDIDFRNGRAESLPFPDGSVDLLLCQFGLMFFSPRDQALREFHRVLDEGGRLVLSTWDRLDLHPLDLAMHNLSLKHLGVSGLQDVYSLGDAGELAKLVGASGFRDVGVQQVSKSIQFADPEGYIAWNFEVDPERSPILRELDARGRDNVLSSMRAELAGPLKQHLRDGKLALDMHAHFVQAVRDST